MVGRVNEEKVFIRLFSPKERERDTTETGQTSSSQREGKKATKAKGNCR